MPSETKTRYRFTTDKAARLSLESRILLFMYRRDLERGRNGNVADRYGELKETIFLCSSAFVHFADVIFCNVVYWDELDEYHGSEPREGQERLPTGFVALARSTVSYRTIFNRQLAKFVTDGLIYAFRDTFRALSPLGSRTAPLLQVWDRGNRDKPKDILAVALRDGGFQQAAALDGQHRQICPWQIHEAIVADREFAQQLIGSTQLP
jgi:hypothetical protein